MLKQTGVFKINGTIDDTTFYEKEGVFYARRAAKGPSKQQMLNRHCEAQKGTARKRAVAIPILQRAIKANLLIVGNWEIGEIGFGIKKL